MATMKADAETVDLCEIPVEHSSDIPCAKPQADGHGSCSSSLTADTAPASDNDESLPTDIPDEFICPLTLEMLVDPLMDRNGRNFERKAIIEWLSQNDTCPLTRQPLSYSKLVPNVQLRLRIQEWRKLNGLPELVEEEIEEEEVASEEEDDLEEALQLLGGRLFPTPVSPRQEAQLRRRYRQLVMEAIAQEALDQLEEEDRRRRRRRRLRLGRRRVSNEAVSSPPASLPLTSSIGENGNGMSRQQESSEENHVEETPRTRRRRLAGLLDTAFSAVRLS